MAERGEIVGPYRLERELGRGAFGTVFLAEHSTLGRQVALKISDNDDLAYVERYRTEARLQAPLSHVNIAAFFDTGTAEDGRVYLAREYLEGESLDLRLAAQGPLTLTRSLDVARQVAAALAYAHSQQVLHRGGCEVQVIQLVLGEIADAQVAPRLPLAGHVALQSTEHAHERGFAGSVAPE